MKFRVFVAVCGIVITAGMASILYFHTLRESIYVPTFHMDGAFQTASTLFRMAEGQLPQRDFFPYLGIGPIFVIFPAFMAFGGTLIASVQASFVVTMMIAWFSAAVVWRLVFIESNWRVTVVASATVLAAVLAVAAQVESLSYLEDIIDPGNSLRPIRAAIPYLTTAFVLIIIRSGLGPWQKTSLFSAVFACTLLWSNDFALPTFATFLAFVAILFLRSFGPRGLLYIVVIGVMSVLLWLVLLTVITQGQTLGFLTANYVDAAGAQWWYFGPYQDAKRVYDLSDVARIVWHDAAADILMLVCLIGYFLRDRKLESALLLALGFTLFLGGLFPTTVAFASGYFVSLKSFSALVVIVIASRLVFAGFQLLVETRPGIEKISKGAVISILSLLMATAGLSAFGKYTAVSANASSRDDHFFADTLGGYLDKEWEDYLAFFDRRKDSIVIEEYWGVSSASIRQFPNWPADSVIHLFGDARNLAVRVLADADYVTSSRFEHSPEFQPWGLTQNYWFYGVLFRQFEIVAKSPTTIVWKRADQSRRFEDVACRVADNGKDILLDDATEGLHEVSVSYSVTTPNRRLLLLRNNLGSGTGGMGLASLAPDGTEATIPVWVDNETGFVLQSFLTGRTPEEARFMACEARRIDFEDRDVVRHIAPDCTVDEMIEDEPICAVLD